MAPLTFYIVERRTSNGQRIEFGVTVRSSHAPNILPWLLGREIYYLEPDCIGEGYIRGYQDSIPAARSLGPTPALGFNGTQVYIYPTNAPAPFSATTESYKLAPQYGQTFSERGCTNRTRVQDLLAPEWHDFGQFLFPLKIILR
jgi:hypothetical protein